MKDSKRQTMLMTGVALMVAAGIIIYVSLSSPRVYDRPAAVSTEAVSATRSTQKTSVEQTEQTKLQYPLDINKATAEELATIDGIGEKRADDIIAYRRKIGGYKSVEQIKSIKGIGDELYSSIAPYLKV